MGAEADRRALCLEYNVAALLLLVSQRGVSCGGVAAGRMAAAEATRYDGAAERSDPTWKLGRRVARLRKRTKHEESVGVAAAAAAAGAVLEQRWRWCWP